VSAARVLFGGATCVCLAAGAGVAAASELGLPQLTSWSVAGPIARERAFAGGDLAAVGEATPALHQERRPVLVLAQRAIERDWGASDDSIYVEHDVPGWRSEGFAMAMSAVLPGAGQAYAGEPTRGLWFALAEAAGWITRQVYRHRGDALRDDAAAFAGTPGDSASAWSFERFRDVTGEDAAELEALYAGDRDAFFERIATDPRFAAGWSGEEGRRHFAALREISDDRLRLARYAGTMLWLNHLAAAVDAIRVARARNLPLTPRVSLEIETDWRHGRPALVAAVVRRF
jgi:hypothetical protein